MASKFTFIQTSDLRLGRKFPHMGDFGQKLESAVKDTFKTIISLVRRDKVNALFVAGNLFDSPNPPEDLVKYVKENFSILKKTQVFITPGQWDPRVSDSVYLDRDWPPNVNIFRSGVFIPLFLDDFGVVVYGYAHTSHRVEDNPLDQFKPRDEKDAGLKRILLFNGTITDTGLYEPTPTAPFKYGELMNADIFYAALGHFHKVQSIKNNRDKSIKACYSGCPQGFGFEDEGEKGVLKISIEDDKKKINFMPAAQLVFQSLHINCQGMRDEEELINRLETIAEKKNMKYNPTKIILTGTLDMDRSLDVGKIRKAIEPRCIKLEVENRTLSGYDYGSIFEEKSTRGFFTKTMMEKINSLRNNGSGDGNEEIEIYELALKYGLDAFTKEEVKKRWL